MQRAAAVLGVAAVVVMAAQAAAQAKPSFAGEWKRVASAGEGQPGADLKITQDAATLTVEFRAGDPSSGTRTYKLDGSASRNTSRGRDGGAPAEQVSTAAWAANSLVVTTATGAGEEKRTFSMDGDRLVVDTSAPAKKGGAPTTTRVTYQRYVRGHGG